LDHLPTRDSRGIFPR